MPSILSGFDTVQQALAAQQFALSITQKNIANANNPNYTRQDVVYTGDETEWVRSGVPGVTLQAVRDRFLDYSIGQESQSLAEYSVVSDALRQIDSILNGSGEGLQQAISDFFNSFASLSSFPGDMTLRQGVLSSAEALAREFHRLYAGMQQVQISQDQTIITTVEDINAITEQIAQLNVRVREAQGLQSEEEFTLRDSRQQLLEQLSSLTGLSYYETESGAITVTTRQGGLLVCDAQSYDLELTSSTAGAFRGVSLNGTDVTGSIESGKLGGLIDLRDSKIAGYLSVLDDLAAAIISRVNEQHAQGIDLGGEPGGDFFVPFAPVVVGSTAGAARTMTVSITNPSQIAAAGAGMGIGNNANAKLLADIADEKLLNAATASAGQYYATLIYTIGLDEKTADENMTVQGSVLDQLKNQRDALSGVNFDEEAINVIKYQKAYQASARYANVLDLLSDEILNLLGA
jgi:flagellar hook-associated protein 1 FlgK